MGKEQDFRRADSSVAPNSFSSPTEHDFNEFVSFSFQFRSMSRDVEPLAVFPWDDEAFTVREEWHDPDKAIDYSSQTIEQLTILRERALSLLKCEHYLAFEAHALIYQILDTMFSGLNHYMHSDELMIEEYRELLTAREEGTLQSKVQEFADKEDGDTEVMAIIISGLFELDPEIISDNWKSAYNKYWPSLEIVVGKIRTCIEMANVTAAEAISDVGSKILTTREREVYTILKKFSMRGKPLTALRIEEAMDSESEDDKMAPEVTAIYKICNRLIKKGFVENLRGAGYIAIGHFSVGLQHD